VFKVVRDGFVKFGAGPVSWGGLTAPRRSDPRGGDLTALGTRSNRPRQSEQVFALCCIAALAQGECALAQGELACV
jgi:hypothetical protein